MKTGIRYLRFSDLNQSNGSIERQDLYTSHWMENNKVEIVDTFIDRGRSAKTFNRPDFKKLQEFVSRHHKKVDYLVVDQLDRFSRDSGDAIKLIKQLQVKYNIQIVSVTEGIIFDYSTPGSFFRTGLQLLLAEEDNINRSVKVRGGIYTAKARDGRYIYRTPPYGYRKEGQRKERKLVVQEDEAKIVRYIYNSFLHGMPIYLIHQEARKLGFKSRSNDAIHRILKQPAYAALLHVEPFKDYEGGLFPAIHEPIVSTAMWKAVQNIFAKPEKPRVIIEEELPLRGLLKCYCGQPLTGAPSKGKSGKYFYYYKCRKSRHLNLSAKKAHDQLNVILDLLSLPKAMITDLQTNIDKHIVEQEKTAKVLRNERNTDLLNEESKLHAMEEKLIEDKIDFETFQKWRKILKEKIANITSEIEHLSMTIGSKEKELLRHLPILSDFKTLYEKYDLIAKRELLTLVFDRKLHYENGCYRTPYINAGLSHNILKMKEKGVLFKTEKRDCISTIPLSGDGRIRTPDRVSPIHTFQACSFSHSDTSP